MVGRSRGCSKRKTEFDTTDISFLKTKNTELAKALADTKTLYNHAVADRNYYQKELFAASLHITKLQNYINNIDASTRETLNCVVALSNHSTDILRFVNYSRRLTTLDSSHNQCKQSGEPSRQSFSSPNKTQAVKPMIDGHVIFRPTINLRRVNEIPPAEIQSLRSEGNLQEERNYHYADSASTDDSATNNSFQRRSSTSRISFRRISEGPLLEEINNDDVNNDDELEDSLSSSDIVGNRRLETVEEVDGHLENSIALENRRSSSSSSRSRTVPLSGNNAQMPLLSGVFRDVRVYLSPVDPHCNVTKVRGSTKSYKLKRSSESQSGNRPSTSTMGNANQTTPDREQSINSSSFITNFAEATYASTPLQRNSSNFREIPIPIDSDEDSDDTLPDKDPKKSTNRRHTECSGTPKKYVFTRPSQPTSSKLGVNTDYDPLEGPSNLLDNIQNNKEDTLAKLGLIPISDQMLSPPKQPSSPATTVLRKRESKGCILENRSPNKFVTKRKLRDKKKKSIVSSKVVSLSPSKDTHIENKSTRSTQKRSKRLEVLIKQSPGSPAASSFTTPTNSPQIKKTPKRERRKRPNAKGSLKEPSLVKKLRRS